MFSYNIFKCSSDKPIGELQIPRNEPGIMTKTQTNNESCNKAELCRIAAAPCGHKMNVFKRRLYDLWIIRHIIYTYSGHAVCAWSFARAITHNWVFASESEWVSVRSIHEKNMYQLDQYPHNVWYVYNFKVWSMENHKIR